LFAGSAGASISYNWPYMYVSVEISSVDMTPCSLVRTHRRFRGNSAFKVESNCFYRTIYKYLPSYTASHTRRNQSS